MTSSSPIIQMFFSAFLLFPTWAFAQQTLTTDSKKAIKYYQQAQAYERSRQPNEALEALKQAVKEDSTFGEAHLLLARFYSMYFPDNRKMGYHYRVCARLYPQNPMFLDAYFVAAQIEMANNHYELASKYADQYISTPKDRKPYLEDLQRIKRNAAFAAEAIKHPVDFNPVPLPKTVNMVDMQYYPSLTADLQTLYFTAQAAGRDENLFKSIWKDGAWSEPEYIQELNTYENEGSCFVSADGRIMVFSAVEGRIRKNHGLCDLYIARLEGGKWSQPENIGPPVNTEKWESQPSLSADGRKLFFVIKDKENGIGSYDIWMSEMDNNKQWSAPTNLGAQINTPYDEFTPFIHPNGKTLYFSSNGHPSFGGLDIFKSELVDGVWQKPTNIGYPINDGGDQRSFIISADGSMGLMTQTTTIGGVWKGRLVSFALPEELAISKRSGYIKGVVYDAETKAKLDATIELVDLTSSENIGKTNSDEINGEYLMVLTQGSRYGLFANREGYLFESLSFDWRKQDSVSGIQKDIYLKPIKEGAKITLNNLFFGSGSYQLEDASKIELNKLALLLNDNPAIKIKVSGHTDHIGEADDNLKLSLNRATSVTNYLTEQGISTSRLIPEGMGEKQPIAPNDTKEGRAMNRRIEMEIK